MISRHGVEGFISVEVGERYRASFRAEGDCEADDAGHTPRGKARAPPPERRAGVLDPLGEEPGCGVVFFLD
jgi:hypothetical protein